VPCYNEGKRLPLAEFEEFFSENRSGLVFLFVNDGSHDNTAEVLGRLCAAHPDRAHVLCMSRNGGKAEAVRRGINHSLAQGYAYTGFWDADLATPLRAIPDFLELIEEKPSLDIVIGSRVKLLGRRIDRRASRHYIGRVSATAISMVLKLPVYDTQCGAKLFRTTQQIKAVFRDPFLSRWIFDVEIIARYIQEMGCAAEAARRIYEYPLMEWKDVAGSKLKPSDFFLAGRDLWRIRRRYRIR
jgi:glycosyltransferase involved in cell wall biosynthesis